MEIDHEVIKIASIFKKYPVALVGCRALGINTQNCEYDFLVITNYKEDFYSIKSDNKNIDVLMVPREKILSSPNSKLAITIYNSKVLWDNEWIFSVAMRWIKEHGFEFFTREEALTSLLYSKVKLSRALSSYQNGEYLTSIFWTYSSIYEAINSYLLLNNMIPSPSHIFEQLKNISVQKIPNFLDRIRTILDLDLASGNACKNRINALEILKKTLEFLGITENFDANPSLIRTPMSSISIENTNKKVEKLIEEKKVINAFFYTGLVIVSSIEQTYSIYCKLKNSPTIYEGIISTLEDLVNKLIGENLVNKLVYNVDKSMIENRINESKLLITSLSKLFN